jgi:hypothetical protein
MSHLNTDPAPRVGGSLSLDDVPEAMGPEFLSSSWMLQLRLDPNVLV